MTARTTLPAGSDQAADPTGTSQAARRGAWLVFGLGAPVALAVALHPLEGPLPAVAVAELLVLPVVAVAVTGRRLVASASALAGALAYDVLYTEPRGSVAVHATDDVVVVVVLLSVGLLVAQVAHRGRRERGRCERTTGDLAMLRAVAQEVADGERVEVVAMTAAYWLRELLSLRDCRLDWSTGATAARIDLGGVVHVGALRWAADVQGLPGPTVDLPLHRNGRVVGRFVLTPSPGVPVLGDRLLTAVALADLVAGATGVPDHTGVPGGSGGRDDERSHRG